MLTSRVYERAVLVEASSQYGLLVQHWSVKIPETTSPSRRTWVSQYDIELIQS